MATPADAEKLLEIYRPYLLHSPTSFEIDPPSSEEFAERIRSTLETYPWLVIEERENILGYAYASMFKPRAAYAWSVETTIYMAPSSQGKGLGRKLYAQLLEELRSMGVVNAVGTIVLPNEGSVRLHERLGFVAAGKFADFGFKQGKWWSIGFWQLRLSEVDKPQALSEVYVRHKS